MSNCLNLCALHQCQCRSLADVNGLHSFLCKTAPGRTARYQALNDLIARSFVSAVLPLSKSPRASLDQTANGLTASNCPGKKALQVARVWRHSREPISGLLRRCLSHGGLRKTDKYQYQAPTNFGGIFDEEVTVSWPISVGKSRLYLATTGTAPFSSSTSQF